jgi:hypothetical protein
MECVSANVGMNPMGEKMVESHRNSDGSFARLIKAVVRDDPTQNEKIQQQSTRTTKFDRYAGRVFHEYSHADRACVAPKWVIPGCTADLRGKTEYIDCWIHCLIFLKLFVT